MISKEQLVKLYIEQKKSMSSIAKKLDISYSYVNYLITKFNISKRTNGESKMINIINQKFGKWTVIEQDSPKIDKRGWRKPRWKCKCECGKVLTILYASLVNGLTKQCRKCSYIQMRSGDKILQTHWSRFVRGAIKRNLIFNITKEEAYKLLEKQEFKCALSGIPIRLPVTASAYSRNEYTASIDRIDSYKGYELDNIQWVHKDINFMKSTYTNDEFKFFCIAISNNTTEPEKLRINNIIA